MEMVVQSVSTINVLMVGTRPMEMTSAWMEYRPILIESFGEETEAFNSGNTAIPRLILQATSLHLRKISR